MAILLMWDTVLTMQDEIAASQIDLLRAELGGDHARYRCIHTCTVIRQRHLVRGHGLCARKNAQAANRVRTVKVGEVIEALEHVFTRNGDVRIRIADGWVNYSHGGLTGTRNFALMIKPGEAPRAGKIR